MDDALFKKRGRVQVNKLDWLIAIACWVFAFGSISLSIGIAVGLAFQGAADSFLVFLRGLGFIGWSNPFSILTTILFYSSLAYVIVGFILFKKKGKANKIPGLFIEFVGMTTLLLLLAFVSNFFGPYKGQVATVSLVFAIIFIALQALVIVYGTILTLNPKANIEMGKRSEKQEPASAK